MRQIERHRVVLSYAREDKPFAQLLADHLTDGSSRAIDVWYDRVIAAGADWRRTIDEKVDGCESLVVIVSEAALASPQVAFEIGRASVVPGRTLPVLCPGAPVRIVQTPIFLGLFGNTQATDMVLLLPHLLTRCGLVLPPRLEAFLSSQLGESIQEAIRKRSESNVEMPLDLRNRS